MIRSSALIVALVLAAPALAAGQPATSLVRLPVPYLSQTEALCGGAAVAMVYRYWGDVRADPQQFASLVDTRAGGIAEDNLVAAIVDRGWRAVRLDGSLELLREQIDAGRPVIVLVEDRPGKYHYLVVTGVEADGVIVHDPSWGPSRSIPTSDLLNAWKPARFWMLVVTPGNGGPPETEELGNWGTEERGNWGTGERGNGGTGGTGGTGGPGNAEATECDVLTDAAVARVKARGLDEADEAFAEVQAQCPDSATPLRELAGVRFAQKRWADAEALAARALELDPADSYGWDVLASSRFVQNDLDGALRAWNRIGQPRVDTIQITGLTRARYETIAQTLGLKPHHLLTPESLTRARRRVNELPDRAAASVSFVPAEDGYASVTVALVERRARPRGAAQWAIATAGSLIDREIAADIPGFTGQGEMWSASWRWWPGRPRAAVAFTTPRIGRFGGIWRAEGSWESQRYAAPQGTLFARETRGRAALTVSDWVTARLRYSAGAAFDEWNGGRRSIAAHLSLEQLFAGDRIGIAGGIVAGAPLAPGPAFQSAAVRADARSSIGADSTWVLTAAAGAAIASANAPLAFWPGAGDGHARPALLRAHQLVEDGVIGGQAFGRRLTHASAEVQRWRPAGALARIGVAAFVDAARAASRLDGTTGPLQVDAGAGLRLKVAGSGGILRVDVARGLRDGAVALTAGWQIEG